MRNPNRRALAPLMAPLMALGLAACGGEADKAGSAADTSPAQSSKTLAAAIGDEGDLDTLQKMVDNAGLSDVLEGKGPYTVFAPANAAIGGAGDDLSGEAMKAQSAALYDAMAAGVEASGGSAGNTVAGIGSFGGRAAYVGKVAPDTLGQVFTHDIRAAGVHFDTPVLEGGAGTGRCLINVTPDGQRTMSTFLGAANQLAVADIDADLIGDSAIVVAAHASWPGASPDDVLAAIDLGSAQPPMRAGHADPLHGFWTLDPVDGTKGFLRGEQYAVIQPRDRLLF